MKFERLGEQVNLSSQFLSGITELPVTSVFAYPELNSEANSWTYGNDVNLNFALELGGPEGFMVWQKTQLMYQPTHLDYLAGCSWGVTYKGEQIFRRGNWINTSENFLWGQIEEKRRIENFLTAELSHTIGGPDIRLNRRGYKDYPIEKLGGSTSATSVLMLFQQNELGLSIPTPMATNEVLYKAMERGDMETVSRMLATALIFMGGLSQREITYMNAEAQTIRFMTQEVQSRKNTNIPLEIAYPDIDMHVLEGKRQPIPPRNILVVENDPDMSGVFHNKVIKRLEENGRFKGSTLIYEKNLKSCMELCSNGRIDLILFDWTNPSEWEALMFDDASGGGTIQVNDNGILWGRGDGVGFTSEELKEEAERLDIREKWMNMIAEACREAGVIPPAHFVFKDYREYIHIAEIVLQKLGQTLK